jgi:hypothetical protein
MCCELLWSLFCASLFSYRRASVCDPFPVAFISETDCEKNFNKVEACLKQLPDLHHLSTHPRSSIETHHKLLYNFTFKTKRSYSDGFMVYLPQMRSQTLISNL